MVVDQRYERGVVVYVSQFPIPYDVVAAWFAERIGACFGKEAILSVVSAWSGDELRLREPHRRGAHHPGGTE